MFENERYNLLRIICFFLRIRAQIQATLQAKLLRNKCLEILEKGSCQSELDRKSPPSTITGS